MTEFNTKDVASMKLGQNVSWNNAAIKLADDIATARLAPGRRLTVALLSRWLRTTTEVVNSIVPAFLESKSLVKEGDEFVIATIDRIYLLGRLEGRLQLEQIVAQAATRGASPDQIKSMRGYAELMKRCAIIGDIDGYMRADLELELVIGSAADLPVQFEELCSIKREFRRAWLAYNRLRDLSEPAGLRQELVENIAAHDSESASQSVADFISYLRRSF